MFGEVFLCQFPFTSGVATKIRPALVLFDLTADVMICRITSVLRAGPLDVTLGDWQAAGLLKPSIARLDRVGLPKSLTWTKRRPTSPSRLSRGFNGDNNCA